MRAMQRTCALIGLLLSLCGCNGVSHGSGSGASAAPSSLSYATPTASYAVGVAVTANAPTSSGGAVASYDVVPTLPWGLSLDTTSGVISGIPTVATPQENYTVTAYNAGGSASVTLRITVTNGAPANLSYSNNAPVYTVNSQIIVNVPKNTGGEPTQYAVNRP